MLSPPRSTSRRSWPANSLTCGSSSSGKALQRGIASPLFPPYGSPYDSEHSPRARYPCARCSRARCPCARCPCARCRCAVYRRAVYRRACCLCVAHGALAESRSGGWSGALPGPGPRLSGAPFWPTHWDAPGRDVSSPERGVREHFGPVAHRRTPPDGLRSSVPPASRISGRNDRSTGGTSRTVPNAHVSPGVERGNGKSSNLSTHRHNDHTRTATPVEQGLVRLVHTGGRIGARTPCRIGRGPCGPCASVKVGRSTGTRGITCNSRPGCCSGPSP